MNTDQLPSFVAEFGDVEDNPISFDTFLQIFESRVLPNLHAPNNHVGSGRSRGLPIVFGDSPSMNDSKDIPGWCDDELVAELFERYDLDNSGTINSHEELLQLTTHLLVKLSIRIKVDHVYNVARGFLPNRCNDWMVTAQRD